MKKILLIAICVLSSITCFAQKIDLNDKVSLKPVNKLVRISKEEAKKFESEKFHDEKHVRLDELGNLPTFKIGNILITLNSEKAPLKSGHLISLKKGIDAMSATDFSYHSSLETINSQKVLITTNSTVDMKNYQFTCVNQSNNTIIVGLLRFKPTDDAEAKQVLDDLVKNIVFKE